MMEYENSWTRFYMEQLADGQDIYYQQILTSEKGLSLCTHGMHLVASYLMLKNECSLYSHY